MAKTPKEMNDAWKEKIGREAYNARQREWKRNNHKPKPPRIKEYRPSTPKPYIDWREGLDEPMLHPSVIPFFCSQSWDENTKTYILSPRQEPTTENAKIVQILNERILSCRDISTSELNGIDIDAILPPYPQQN